MQKGDITLNKQEQRRLLVLNQLESGALVNQEAADLLGLSVRQLRRLHSAYRVAGAAALAHGNRGRRPAHALDPDIAKRVVELATSTYQGFNQQHLTEMLGEREHIQLSRVSVHRILKAAGIAPTRRRRASKHRRRRDRYPRAGMLLQVDASRHDWLEGRGPYLSLVGAIDDATGLVPWAVFRDQEDAQGYFDVLRQVVRRRGIPMAIYSDRHSIFFQTKDKSLSVQEQLEAREHPTQFGRLLEELGVELILARSPQAKGRVERLWGTFQDRLTSELRLARASTAQEAQEILARYLPRHNARFVVAPNDPIPAWLKWPGDQRLDDYFCFKYRRTVANDNTVRFEGQVFDLPPSPHRPTFAHARVEVREHFDGTTSIHYQGHRLLRQRVVSSTLMRVRDNHQVALDPPAPRPERDITAPRPPRALNPWKAANNASWARRQRALGQNR